MFYIEALKTVLESLNDERLADDEQVASLRLLLQQKNVQSLVAVSLCRMKCIVTNQLSCIRDMV